MHGSCRTCVMVKKRGCTQAFDGLCRGCRRVLVKCVLIILMGRQKEGVQSSLLPKKGKYGCEENEIVEMGVAEQGMQTQSLQLKT